MKFSLKKSKFASKIPADNRKSFSLKKKVKVVRKSKVVGKVEIKRSGLFESNAIKDDGKKIGISTITDIDAPRLADSELVIKPIQSRREIFRKNKQISSNLPSYEHQPIKYGINNMDKKGKMDYLDNQRTDSIRQKPVPLTSYDVPSCVSETTEESYEKVPVEKFGLAMLRGMGWKGDVTKMEKEEVKKDNASTSRPLLLGLGAKPSAVQLDPSYRVSSANYEPVTRVTKNSGSRGGI